MKKYQIALIVGRFQPFHNGHLYLLKKALLIAEKVIFGIGSASIYDENNPLSYEQRKTMIETVVKNEKISDRVIKIVPLEDFYNDEKWLKNLCKQVGGFDMAMGNNEWTNKVLKKAGYKIIKVDHYKRYLYEGWRIRKLIRSSLSSRVPPLAGSRDLDWQKRVPEYIKYQISKIKNTYQKSNIFNNLVLGGTFDHFHKGHKALINKALECGKNITIGIATEELFKNKLLNQIIEPFSTRKKNIKKYIEKKIEDDRLITNYKIISFSDIYGTAGTEKKFGVIIVSKLTYPNALKINQLRKKNKLSLLRIIIVSDVLADDGKLISSERIRAGEIDREGRKFEIRNSKFKNKEILMPEDLREELRKPIGKVYKSVGAIFKSPKKPIMVIAVGDIIVNSLEKEGFTQDIKIIDYRSRRKKITYKDVPYKDCLYQRQSLFNKPGTINLKTAKVIKEKIKLALYKKTKSWIVIDGEEDLLALPSILFAPLNSLVIYGHWQLGIVVIEVDEKMKKKARNIINKFV